MTNQIDKDRTNLGFAGLFIVGLLIGVGAMTAVNISTYEQQVTCDNIKTVIDGREVTVEWMDGKLHRQIWVSGIGREEYSISSLVEVDDKFVIHQSDRGYWDTQKVNSNPWKTK